MTNTTDLLHPLTPTTWSKLCTLPLRGFSKAMCRVSHGDEIVYYPNRTDTLPEFMPYIFQLFAALLEANPSKTLPNYYQNLISPILMPIMWESKGNIPALVRLLSSIIGRGSQYILENNQIMPILGIFQKLLSTKANESHGFDLLESVVAVFPP